ncbi:MAG: type toxin-antitoxin system HipA family toxin [Acidimicrobiaceae bacterium]|nr:type toxin-antitoxin system HipA family toxin [Acidimicrobiaceae bacterium]
MAESELVCLINGKRLGVITQTKNGPLELTYDSGYLNDRSATPLSLSMPLAAQTYGNRSVRPFLLGLLPDNREVIESWATRFDVSPENPFALLAHVGEDCAGAVQFIPPERLGAERQSGITWLDDEGVEERLRAIRLDPTAWLGDDDDAQGQFSLAGAQSKVALYRSPDGRWGHPYGDRPTSHILKVASSRFEDQDIVEHVTMLSAGKAGITTARSEVMEFGAERAIVVERYDRMFEGDAFQRIHQEDLCQTLGLGPEKKYERRGGPGAVSIIEMFRKRLDARSSDDAIERFTEALVFNWLTGGTDAHAKNYSLLLAGPGALLAPLYDLTTGLPYKEQLLGRDADGRPLSRTGRRRGLVMAMSIGGTASINEVGLDKWRKLAEGTHVEIDQVVGTINRLGGALPDAFADAVREARQEFDSPILGETLDLVTENIAVAVERIRSGTSRRPPPASNPQAPASPLAGQGRVQRGVPAGGQFTAVHRPEAVGLELTDDTPLD